MELSERLVHLRKQKGLSQFDVAETLHVSRQAISKWESGSSIPSTDNLRLLGNLYGVTVDFLLNGEENQQISEPPNTNENIPLSNEELHSVKQRSKKVNAILLLVLILAVVMAVKGLIYVVHESKITSIQVMATEDSNSPNSDFQIDW